MSFLDSYNSEILAARITKRGRTAISQGDFVISYFQIGDSEFDYNQPFDLLSGLGTRPSQKVFSPFDKNCGVKYPYKVDSTSNGTTYGVPVMNSYNQTIRNVMGPAGFVSDYREFNDTNCSGTMVECTTTLIDIIKLDGSDALVLPTGSGMTFMNCEYITIAFDQFCGMDPNFPVITGQSNSLIYKVVNVVGDVLYLDRNMPDFTSLTGNVQVICNSCELEYPIQTTVSEVCSPILVDPLSQHDPWTLEVVWGEDPIGYNGNDNYNLTGFTGNKFVSTKQFLGYTTSSGQSINSGTTYTNSYNELIYVEPEEQRVLAIIHYSELGDIKNDPERFYKYDDYISNDNDNSPSNSLVQDENGNDLSDTEYFEVYIPFICYHRNSGTTFGAVFHMDTTEQYVTTPPSIKDGRMSLPFRYLLDENNGRVGRVYYTNKTIVFDDQELVALLDYRSNRRYTLPSPKTFLTPSDLEPALSMFSGTSDQTFWITYTFTNSVDPNLNALPCNYFTKVVGSGSLTNGDCGVVTIPSNISFKFNTGAFNYMKTQLPDVIDGYLATEFRVLVQETTNGAYPSPDLWKEIDFTSQVTGAFTPYLDPTDIENKTFTIYKSDYDSASYFDLESYMGGGYFTSPDAQFGDEQPFPGSVRLVRATDIQVMNFLINLPSSQFTETQNPTYTSGKDKKITDIALLDSNKEPLVIAKMSKPITRIGTQVFAVKLDF